ncbi:MAG: hypothetical protein ACLUOF_00585 [Ruminococcus sp.]
MSHVFANIETGVPYCLTEVLAPADYAIAEPIYFQLDENGDLLLLTVAVDENGAPVVQEDGTWQIVSTAYSADTKAIVMVDEYIGTETTTSETEGTTTTTTTTTTAEETTTERNTTAGNGEAYADHNGNPGDNRRHRHGQQ